MREIPKALGAYSFMSIVVDLLVHIGLIGFVGFIVQLLTHFERIMTNALVDDIEEHVPSHPLLFRLIGIVVFKYTQKLTGFKRKRDKQS